MRYACEPSAQRLRAYMHQQKSLQLREDAERSLPLLSLPLQIEVVRHVHRHWLTAIWFMRDLEEPVKIRMAMAMEPYVLAPREVAPTRRMYVIERGTVIFGGRLLTRHMAWGDDVILSDPKYFGSSQARAITYCDVASISRTASIGHRMRIRGTHQYIQRRLPSQSNSIANSATDTKLTSRTPDTDPSGPKLLEIVSAFPGSAKALRRTTIHLALRRELVLIAKNDAATSAVGTNGERGVERRVTAENINLRGRILEAINTGAPSPVQCRLYSLVATRSLSKLAGCWSRGRWIESLLWQRS